MSMLGTVALSAVISTSITVIINNVIVPAVERVVERIRTPRRAAQAEEGGS
ncbi:hypothetical protein [Streptomyces rubiginosohelvolus]|uniref:hypothetical protein n=1 Tax=Streptomyces rubiginosohelvolus TaxID=67362 RepID=UPI0036ADD376|nr:hypothetical protein OG475_14155 [Streptomyces rubiginosohelvolus]